MLIWLIAMWIMADVGVWPWLGVIIFYFSGPILWHFFFELRAKIAKHYVPADREERWSWFLDREVDAASDVILGEHSRYLKQRIALSEIKEQIELFERTVNDAVVEFNFQSVGRKESRQCSADLEERLKTLAEFHENARGRLEKAKELLLRRQPLFIQHHELRKVAGHPQTADLLGDYEETIVRTCGDVALLLKETKAIPLPDTSMTFRLPFTTLKEEGK